MRFSRFDFVERLKLTIRKMIYFQKRIANLGPMYLNCNERQTACTRRNSDERNGCPNCEFTIQYNYFQKELEKELDYLPRTTRYAMRKWPKEYLLQIAADTASIAGSHPSHKPTWTVMTSLYVSIYRDEVAKMKAIENYKLTQPTGPAEDNLKDVGDFD